ncbi:DUF817 family (YoaT) [Commensalibacter communis]|uniref:DUF817 family (YoaT) n=1 Tax=Commensalibacter communis TaxID=2972786 RepID=A0A9W4TQF8_9PROT|nr:DUF817 domain-containing protein [Commensalibacter communis]CAI3924062.1 DUF817 family (YoaT) [Commensalibacter communis]CAI3924592.1 DUF817 family (YoaT) [Commensalibacter communis]CAI3936767.1 DUF817 family (YoaT) [Commensalibacter communis]CAI3946057.1 DUF817 family (YoaT) [Commensalibacter communis]CAI3946339.1 DUF817 family (YoaT) [Commensalibacter communis]
MNFQQKLDQFLITPPSIPDLRGWKRFCVEFLFFGIKEARSCLFVGLFFLSIFIVPKSGIWIIPRYDALLIIAITIQLWMVFTKLETWDELKAVMLFHIVGFALEVFKTSANIHSWSYPDFAYTKFLNVPLFSGFMYAAIGSYIIQAWRLLDVKIYHHPPYIFAVIISLLIYINFFTHHFLGDYRWYIAATVLGLYARTTVIFTPYDRERKMPLLLAFILIGFFIWLAENISTFFGIWKYPNQITSWSMVHTGKWSSWALLVIMTFTITVFLKHIKKTVYVPQ